MAHICITGANKGIGLALATIYSQDQQVIAMCRQKSEALDALANTTIATNIDVNIHEQRVNAIEIMPDNTDTLILNAGILLKDQQDPTTHEKDILAQIQTNAISPLLMAQMATPKIKKGGKIVLMTSRMGSIADNQSGRLDGYRMSKSALNAAGKNLSFQLKEFGIGVFLIHPGHIQTDMTNHTGMTTPTEVAAKIHTLIHKLTLEQSGTFWHADGYELPW